ncbi:MAG: TVP38/TMEM64 family protein [Alphaproteobacteria bacterium]|jgi:uncharacterized membrane protein YdjX (TVP38/TMEM64 family)|nr:TVP38/TMEM64 family protein [Alphaproteobacteria bacterium]
MKKIKRYLPLLIIVGCALVVWAFGLHQYLSLEQLRLHHLELNAYISLYPIRALALYMGIYIAVVGLSIPGATLMTLCGGYLFGQILGTALVVISATIGATILFVSAKMASQDLLLKRAGLWLKKMKAGFQKDAFYYLLTLRLIPIFPFVAINLVAAFFQMKLKEFVIATFFGIIPGSFIYVSIGNALKEVISTSQLTPQIVIQPKVLLALGGLGVLSLLPILYKRLSKR